MIQKILFFSLLCCYLNVSLAQSDSACSCRSFKGEIIETCHWKATDCWMISGHDSSSIFHVDSCGEIYDFTPEIRKVTNSHFTSMAAVGQGFLIIGTNDDFALAIDNLKVMRIDSSRGLKDQTVSSISFNSVKNKVYIEGQQNSYASIDSLLLNYSSFANSSASNINDLDETNILDENNGEEDFEDDANKTLLESLWYSFKTNFTDFIPAFKGGDSYHKPYIKHKEYRYIRKNIRPCDILFKRVNWQWSNNIIPGFWSHTAIYVGGLHQLNVYFKGIPMLKGKKPSSYIRKHFPKIYRRLLRTSHPIIEAIPGKGVSINPLRHIAKVDYFAALRPDLSKEDQFLSLLKAFEYYKLPYDYLMTFNSKKGMVCSQLIYKAFEPSAVKQGLNFELETLLGDPFLYPTDIVKKFDEEYGTENEELDFVLFFNAKESEKKSKLGTVEEFRKTWKKSRFSLMQD